MSSAEQRGMDLPQQSPSFSFPRTSTVPAAIHLNIDSLVLHGFPIRDRVRIGVAVGEELTRLLGDRIPPALERGGQIDQWDGGGFEMPISTEAVGIQIARAIYGGLS